MNHEHESWSLYNKISKAKMTGLSFSQVRTLVATIEEGGIQNWIAWHESLPDWKPLTEFMSVLLPPGPVKVFHLPPLPPPIPAAEVKISHVEGAKATVPIAESKFSDHEDLRVARRFRKSYGVFAQAMAEKTIFKTETEDISLTGMRLKKSFPDGWADPCSFTLVNKLNQSLEVIATLVPEKNEDRRRFNFVRVPKLKELQAWLTDPKR